MARHLIKIDDDLYMEWSTISDRPIGYILSRKEMEEELLRRGLEDLETQITQRLERTDNNGTSSYYNSTLNDVLDYNRAGPNESKVSLDELLEIYKKPD